MEKIPGAASLVPMAPVPGASEFMRKDELMRKSTSGSIAWDPLPEGGMEVLPLRDEGEEQRLGIVGCSPFPSVFAENSAPSGRGHAKGAGCR